MFKEDNSSFIQEQSASLISQNRFHLQIYQSNSKPQNICVVFTLKYIKKIRRGHAPSLQNDVYLIKSPILNSSFGKEIRVDANLL